MQAVKVTVLSGSEQIEKFAQMVKSFEDELLDIAFGILWDEEQFPDADAVKFETEDYPAVAFYRDEQNRVRMIEDVPGWEESLEPPTQEDEQNRIWREQEKEKKKEERALAQIEQEQKEN